MPGKESETIMLIRRMPFEEKIKLLSKSDRDYVRGYIDRALYATAQERLKSKKIKSEVAHSATTNEGKG